MKPDNGNVHRAAAKIIVSKSRAARGSVCNVLLSSESCRFALDSLEYLPRFASLEVDFKKAVRMQGFALVEPCCKSADGVNPSAKPKRRRILNLSRVTIDGNEINPQIGVDSSGRVVYITKELDSYI